MVKIRRDPYTHNKRYKYIHWVNNKTKEVIVGWGQEKVAILLGGDTQVFFDFFSAAFVTFESF